MKCASCKNELKEGAKFCNKCGAKCEPQGDPKGELLCVGCEAPLKAGAKFCNKCGTKVEPKSDSEEADDKMIVVLCDNCKSVLKPNARFCPKCGVSVLQSTSSILVPESNTMDLVKHKIIWNINPGEVARTIKAAEFVEYDKASGLIVEDGTTAIVRANGRKILEISGGAYDFVDQDEIKRILEYRKSGNSPKILRRIANILFNRNKIKSLGVKIEDLDPKDLESLDRIIECLRREQIMSICLKMDRDFDLIIGAVNPTDDASMFAPMVVRSKSLDLNVALHASFKISNFDHFSKYYLTDRESVSMGYLANDLSPVIRAAIESVLSSEDLLEPRLSAELVGRVKSQIRVALEQLMHGVSLVNVIEVAVSEEGLDRFRALTRELYLSEVELDYLARTNAMQNRLNIAVDEQTLTDARREVDRDGALMAINRDGLLNEDEMEKFKLQLQLQRSIREARTEDEYQSVLSEVRANGLQRALALDLSKVEAQGQITHAQQDIDRATRLHDAETEVMAATIAGDYERKRQDEEDERDRRMAQESMNRLMQMDAMEQEEKRLDHQLAMEREREANEANRQILDRKSQMSAQQLMALASEGNMDSAAATKLAESFSAGMDIQQQKEFMESFNQMNQSRIDDQMANADRMERMMGQMLNATTTMAGGMSREQEAMKNEYRDRLQHQEGRMDSTMDRSLEYATRNNENAPKSAVAAPSAPFYMVDMDGMESQQIDLPRLSLLIKKGKVLANTYVYSSTTNDWLEAKSYGELSHLFAAAVPPPPSAKRANGCPKCGVVNDPDNMFCDKCGMKLNE